jgi:hypothetical protein
MAISWCAFSEGLLTVLQMVSTDWAPVLKWTDIVSRGPVKVKPYLSKWGNPHEAVSYWQVLCVTLNEPTLNSRIAPKAKAILQPCVAEGIIHGTVIFSMQRMYKTFFPPRNISEFLLEICREMLVGLHVKHPLHLCRVQCSLSGGCEEFRFPGYSAVYSVESLLASCFKMVSCVAYSLSLKVGRHIPPKCRQTFKWQHHVISQKT